MRNDEPANVVHLIKPLILLVALLVALAAAELATADTVRVHDAAGSGGPNVTLGQVAELTGDYAQTLSGVVVGKFDGEAEMVELELAELRAAMQNQGVAVGRLNLQGYAKCTVHRIGEPTSDERSAEVTTRKKPLRENARPVDNEPAAANTEGESIGIDTPMTVRRLIIESLVEGLGVAEHDLDITFEERDGELLASSAVAGRFTVEPVVDPQLGGMSFRVREYRGTKEHRQTSVSMTVRQRILAVVATVDIDRGDLIHRGSVAVREVLVEDRKVLSIKDTAHVLNQVASKRFKAGSMLSAQGIEAPITVRRGEQIEVTFQQGQLEITFNGVAKSEGAVGDVIEVEHARTLENRGKRESFYATVTGRRQVKVGEVVQTSGANHDQ